MKLNHEVAPILLMVFVMYGFWNAFPAIMMHNGWKYLHLWLYDTLITGVLMTFITIYLFKNYYSILERNYIILIFTSIITFLIFFYQWFKLSRTGANNWLVKLGDRLHIDKYVETIRIFD
jgi:hypothetical protein